MQSETKPEVNQLSFDGLGSKWWIEADVDQSTLTTCMQIAREFEADYSRFRPDSLLSQLNQSKKLKLPPREMIELLEYAAKSYERTGGLFNITAGAELARRGYGSLGAGDIVDDWTQSLSVSDDQIEIGDVSSIDFGGFGKGWLIDKIHDYLTSASASSVLVNGGGDIRITQPGKKTIPLMHPSNPSQVFIRTLIPSGAIATSSPMHRAWDCENHLVTQAGASYRGQITSLSIVAATAKDADMVATSCLLAQSPDSLAKQLGFEYILTKDDGTYEASPHFPIEN